MGDFFFWLFISATITLMLSLFVKPGCMTLILGGFGLFCIFGSGVPEYAMGLGWLFGPLLVGLFVRGPTFVESMAALLGAFIGYKAFKD